MERLSISKELVNLLGGELKVESKEREGSNFYFTLPCQSIPFTPETIDRERVKGISINLFYPIGLIERRVYGFISEYFKRLKIDYNILDLEDIDILKETNIGNEVYILIDFKDNKEIGKTCQKRLIILTNTSLYKKYNNLNLTHLYQPLKLSILFDAIENNMDLIEKIEEIKSINKIYNILIIDDNMINLKLMGEIIKKLGHKPHLLDSGTEVLALIEAGAISVLTKPIHIDTLVDILNSTIRDK